MNPTGTNQAELRRNRVANLMLVVGLVVLNISVGTLVSLLKLPIYLDSIGIVVAAILLRPQWAVAVGVLTAVIGWLTINPFLCWYTGTAIGIALTASGLARAGLFRHHWTVPVAGLIIGIVAAILSAPVTAYLFSGVTASGVDFLTALIVQTGLSLVKSVFLAGLASDPVDKLIVCVLAYTLCRSLPRRVLDRFPQGRQRLGVGS
jgi:energy-coupling factor transport system substrate-specific component